MIFIRSRFLVLAFVAISCFGAPPRPLVRNVVLDQFRPVAFNQQQLAGIFAQRIRAAREGYLERVNEDGAVAPVAESSARDSSASGETTGKYLEAAANAYEYSHDPNLKAAMDRVATHLITQESSAGVAMQSSTGSLAGKTGAEGWSISDIFMRRSELLGLIAYYRVTADENALNASTEIADALITRSNQTNTGDSGALAEFIQPVTDLYRYTRDQRYLEWARSAAALSAPLIGGSLDENLSRLLGFVDLYRITGDVSLERLVLSAWPTLRKQYFSFFSGADLPDPCVTAAWIQLNLELLRLTGQAQFGSELERAIYNYLFAAQDLRTGAVFSAVPINGKKNTAAASDQCIPHEATGISLLPSAVWGRYGNGIAVILYTGGRASIRLRRRGTVQLYTETTYPQAGEILLHVEPGHPMRFPLRLRVPDWTDSFTAEIGRSRVTGKPGEFLQIARVWKPGDTVKIAINMTVRVITQGSNSDDQIALQRGPEVLALGQTLNPEVKNLSAAGPASAQPAELHFTPTDGKSSATWPGHAAYTIAGLYEGRTEQLVLIPFAEAESYRVFLKKPADH